MKTQIQKKTIFYNVLSSYIGWRLLYTLILFFILLFIIFFFMLIKIVQRRWQFIIQRLDDGRLQELCCFCIHATITSLSVVFQQRFYVASRHVVGNQLLYELVGRHYRISLLMFSLTWLDCFLSVKIVSFLKIYYLFLFVYIKPFLLK